MFDDDPNKTMIMLIQKSVIRTLIGGLRDGDIELDNDMLSAYIPCIFSLEEQIDLIKAIGLIHYDEDRQAQLIVNDFCGVLKDLQRDGIEEMKRR